MDNETHFAAPPAVERALHPALPLIEAIAKWERENGTLAAIMPSEYGDFCRLMADAAVHGSARAVTLHPSDREAIARDTSGFDLVAAIIQHMGDDLIFVADQMPTEDLRRFYNLRDLAREWLIAEGTRLDAILALSGSLVPANPTDRDPA